MVGPSPCAWILGIVAGTVPLAASCAADADADAGPCAASADASCLDRVVVVGRRENLVGAAISASQGLVARAELDERPRLRSGDLLEYVPGLVATQHSGSGKANQYFLRGFNLDHGTDFATSVDGMPVNQRTHGHGQGYTDLNFLIPELVEELEYRKGPYYADVGDFASAGAATFRIAERLPASTVELGAGEYGWARAVAAGSVALGGSTLTYGVEGQTYDGAWTDVDEDVRKKNLIAKWTLPLGAGALSVTAMGYDNRWNAPDQIPQRAVDLGLIGPLGSIDATLGGDSSRRSLSAGWRGPLAGGDAELAGYLIDSDLTLYSNFTYFLDDPVDGDQFRQFDERRVSGVELRDAWRGERWQLRGGLQYRRDDIDRVGLSRTRERVLLAPVRDDRVDEASVGVYLDGEYRFGERWRGYAGLRHDRYEFEVDALQPENSGATDDDDTSFKASVVYAPSAPLELYLGYGQGFHSNDARGTTLRIDPVSGAPAAPVDPLVDSEGAELGLRYYATAQLHATLALWRLDLDSELVFVGDAGNTEASRASTRRGLEAGLYWFGGAGWRGELEASYTDARFDDPDPAGHEIPGAIPLVVSAGLTRETDGGWFVTARVRHFGAYPLIEDGRVESDGSTLLNLRAGRRWGRWTATFDVLNALDSDDHDIDYFYTSALPGDEPIEGVHFHAFESRALRLNVRYAF